MNRNRILQLLFLKLLSYQYCSSSDSDNQQRCYNVENDEICYFKGSDQRSNWSTAYQICNTKGATLPVIRNVDDQNALEKYLKYLQSKTANITVIWTSGKQEMLNDWTWINGQSISNTSRQNLLEGNDDTTHIAIYDNNTLTPLDPDFLSPFFCQYVGEPCTSLLSFQLTNSCIVFYNYMENWFDARDDCLFRGGDLAVLTDGDQQILKYSTRGNFPHIRFWIGLTSISWSWMIDIEKSVKEEVKYSKWSRYAWKTTGDRCIRVEAFNGKWMTSHCSGRVSVICQRRVVGVANSPMAYSQQPFGAQNSGTIVLILVFGIVLGIGASVIAVLISRRRLQSTWARFGEMEKTQTDNYA